MLLYIFLVLPIAVLGDMNGNRIARPLHNIPRPQPPPIFVKSLEVQSTTPALTENVSQTIHVVGSTQRPLAWSGYYNPQRMVPQPMAVPTKNRIPIESDIVLSTAASIIPTESTIPVTSQSAIEVSSEKYDSTTSVSSYISSSTDESRIEYEPVINKDSPIADEHDTAATQLPSELERAENYFEAQSVTVPTSSEITPVPVDNMYSTTFVPVESFKEPEPKYDGRPTQTLRVLPPTQYKPNYQNSLLVRPLPTQLRPLPIAPAKSLQPVFPAPKPGVPLVPSNVKYDSCIDGHKYFAVQQECDSYIECKKNIHVKLFCPDGLLFNPAAKWPHYPCVYPSDVKCEGQIRQAPQPTSECPRQYGYFPATDGDCGNYLMCKEGKSAMMKCPLGLAFNTLTSTCDWPDNVQTCNVNALLGYSCPKPPLDEFGNPSDVITKYRYGKSCKEYVGCQYEHPRLLSCDYGLSFDDASQVCISSEQVLNCSGQN